MLTPGDVWGLELSRYGEWCGWLEDRRVFQGGAPSPLSPFSFCQILTPPKTASCCSAPSNTSWPPSFGVSPSLGPKAVLDPNTFEFEDVG